MGGAPAANELERLSVNHSALHLAKVFLYGAFVAYDSSILMSQYVHSMSQSRTRRRLLNLIERARSADLIAAGEGKLRITLR